MAPPKYEMAPPKYETARPEYEMARPEYETARPEYEMARPEYEKRARVELWQCSPHIKNPEPILSLKRQRYNENKAAMNSAEHRDGSIASPAKIMRLQERPTDLWGVITAIIRHALAFRIRVAPSRIRVAPSRIRVVPSRIRVVPSRIRVVPSRIWVVPSRYCSVTVR